MQKQPGYVELKNGTIKSFSAGSPKEACRIVMKLLQLRTLTRKAFDKAKAVAIYFGLQARQIFPFRKDRNHASRRDKILHNERPSLSRNGKIDVGRRRHFTPSFA